MKKRHKERKNFRNENYKHIKAQKQEHQKYRVRYIWWHAHTQTPAKKGVKQQKFIYFI